MSFIQADLAIGAVMQSIDKGLAIAAAQRVLEREASDPRQSADIAKHLRKIASALTTHATPRKVLESHRDNYNAFFNNGPEAWGGATAIQISSAAEAFGRAAAEFVDQRA